MPMIGGTLGRYFGKRFLSAVLLVFCGIFALVALIDYIEMMRRANDIANVSAILVAKASFYRVPQIAERIMPFCVLIGTMACYLNLSRRLELVVARSAGVSAWQFIGGDRGPPARRRRHHRLQSDLGAHAGAIEAL